MIGNQIVKEWKPEEISRIKEVINSLGARAPGLVLQAAHGERIQLFRIGKTNSNSFTRID